MTVTNMAQMQQFLDAQQAFFQNQLQAAQQQQNAGASIRPKPLSETTPEAWIQWRTRFEAIIATTTWNLNQQKRNLFALMDGSATNIVRGVELSIDDAAVTIIDVLARFENRFLAGRGTRSAYTEFSVAKQMPGESIQGWHGRLMDIHMRMEPTMGPAARAVHIPLQLQFLKGIRDATLRKYVIMEEYANYNLALTRVAQAEAGLLTERESTTSSSQQVGIHAISDKDSSAIAAVSNICYNCNETGHFWRECPVGRPTGMNRRGQGTFRGRGQGRGAPRRPFNPTPRGRGYNPRRGGNGFSGYRTNRGHFNGNSNGSFNGNYGRYKPQVRALENPQGMKRKENDDSEGLAKRRQVASLNRAEGHPEQHGCDYEEETEPGLFENCPEAFSQEYADDFQGN